MQLDLFQHRPPARPWQHRHSDERRAEILSAVATASASAVARRFNVTPNTVVGLVHRARLAGVVVATFRPARLVVDDSVPKYVPGPRPVPTPRVPQVSRPMPTVEREVEPVVAVVAPVAYGSVALAAAGPRHCRAIESDDLDAAVCCGRDTGGRGSWCAEHRERFRRPATLRPVKGDLS